MVLIYALCKDAHKTITIFSDHIPRVGESIVLPSATKEYFVKKVEYWIDKETTSDWFMTRYVQLLLELRK